jgi:transcriptional regulator with XRE-family HTH domain
MTSTALEEAGYAVRKARLDLGWNMETLAEEALGNGARKGYVGQVEKGKKNLSAETIDKFDQALSLPDDVVKAAHMARKMEVPSPEETKLDETAERLIEFADRDPAIPQMGETLLVALAYEFAGGKQLDLQTAYVGLRKALEAADRIRKRGEMPPDNTGSQLNAVMAEVAKLNADGELDEANDLLDAEEKRMKAEHKAAKERLDEQSRRLLEQRLDQDRLRNDPEAAADRLILEVRRQSPVGGVV